MSDAGPPELERLSEQLDRVRARNTGSKPAASAGDPALQQGVGVGLRIGIEFVVSVVVATGLGWALDHWLGTRPWGMIILFFLGVAAGMVSVYRAVAGINTAVGFRRPDQETGKKPQDAKDDGE
ncbi:MAG TPA: AtpZ/AtpI family protein [Stellaceae bacterium]|jgi:ATP synthase protein I|nr:AtpZ/AtpI family protein [Stellaceae bacterium]